MFCALTRTTVYYLLAFTDYISAIFNTFFIIFLLHQQLKSKNQEYSSIYWSLLTIGYTVASIHSFVAFFRDAFGCYSEAFTLILGTVEWYFLFFLSFWNFILGMYRCTALGFPMKHEQLWSNKKWFVIILNLIFPFIVNGFNFFGNNCVIFGLTEICKSQLVSYLFMTFIINSVFSILTLAFVIFVIFKAKNVVTSNMNFRTKVERRFIIQTILSTISQTLFYFFYCIRIFCPDCDKGTLIGIALVFYIIHHYSNMIVFLVVSPIFRRNFFQFYRIPFGKNFKIENQTFVKVQTISTISKASSYC